MPDMSKIMRQAQEMQRKLQEQQEAVAKQEVTGEAGAGLVKIVINGRYKAKSVSLDDSITTGLSSDDKEILEDLICAAFNDASNKVETKAQDSMADLTSGFKLPGGLGGLFK